MCIGINSFNTEAKNTQINKIVAGKYREGSNIDYVYNNDDISEYEEGSEENKNNESLAKEVNMTQAAQVQGETTIADAQENKSSLGKAIKAELTAYTNDPRCTGGKTNWKTAMETKTRLGVIAAPSNVALGSKIYIPELKNYKADGMFSVEDRGGAIKVKKDGTYVIDVWVPSYEEAVKFGRKSTTIYLME